MGINVDVLNPLKIHHFTRDDGQKITMITFLCKPITNLVDLSEEHTEYIWCNIEESFSKLHPAFHEELKIIKKYFFHHK